MTAALLAAKLIAVFEGCRLIAYWDPTGRRWTIGFGHTGPLPWSGALKEGDQITLEQAADLLEIDEAPLFKLVADRPLIEAAALASFGINCGIGALERVLSGSIAVDREEFMSGQAPFGEMSNGVRLPGLCARRQLEAALIEAGRTISEVKP